MNAWNGMSILFLYVYMCRLPIQLWKKADFYYFSADTICSCIEAVTSYSRTPWVMTAWDMMSIPLLYVYIWQLFILLKKKKDFPYFSCRYHKQLHWSCWRAVPAHHGLWLYGTWCQYYCCMCIYVYCLFCLKIQIFIIVAADTICSCTEAVDEQFQDILGSECM